MKKPVTIRTKEKAVEDLLDLYDRYKERPNGQRLTQEVIRKALGIRNLSTINGWFADPKSPYFHEPRRGISLDALNAFLDKCKNPKYVERIIKEGAK